MVVMNLNMFYLNNMKSILSDAAGIAIALIGLIFTVLELTIIFKQERTEKFKIIDKFLSSNYVFINQEALQMYKNIYSKSNFSVIEDNCLIFPNENWIPDFANGLVPIDNVKLVNDERISDIAPRKLGQRPENVIRKILPKKGGSFVENTLLYTNKKLWNGPTFVVKKTKDENRNSPIITLSASYNYYEFYNTCISYGHLQAYAINNRRYRKIVYNLRKKNELLDYTNRYCGVGVVTLTILKGIGNTAKMLLHYRSGNVAVGRSLLNAVPAGSLQPFSSSIKYDNKEMQSSLKINIIRELGEELLGRKEFADCYNLETYDSNDLTALLKDKLYYLGMGFNPLDTYLEILSLAIIDFSQEETRTFFNIENFGDLKFSNEKILNLFTPNEEGSLLIQDFTTENLKYISNLYNAAPALRQICKILENNKAALAI